MERVGREAQRRNVCWMVRVLPSSAVTVSRWRPTRTPATGTRTAKDASAVSLNCRVVSSCAPRATPTLAMPPVSPTVTSIENARRAQPLGTPLTRASGLVVSPVGDTRVSPISQFCSPRPAEQRPPGPPPRRATAPPGSGRGFQRRRQRAHVERTPPIVSRPQPQRCCARKEAAGKARCCVPPGLRRRTGTTSAAANPHRFAAAKTRSRFVPAH